MEKEPRNNENLSASNEAFDSTTRSRLNFLFSKSTVETEAKTIILTDTPRQALPTVFTKSSDLLKALDDHVTVINKEIKDMLESLNNLEISSCSTRLSKVAVALESEFCQVQDEVSNLKGKMKAQFQKLEQICTRTQYLLQLRKSDDSSICVNSGNFCESSLSCALGDSLPKLKQTQVDPLQALQASVEDCEFF